MAPAALVALAVYLLTAHWSSGQVDDTQAAIWPAWNFVHHGSFLLDNRPTGMPDLVWFQQVDGHLVSHRMMGAILANVPLCAALVWSGLSPEHLNALNGALMTACTVATMSLLLRRLVGDRFALVVTLVLAFGMPLWTTTAAETWPHTLDILCLALALFAVSRSRWWLAGLALAPAMTSRPHLAVVALVLGVGLAVSRRSVRPMVGIGLPTSVGMAVLVAWNRWMFGVWSVGGAYRGQEQKMTSVPSSSDVVSSWLSNVAGAFVSPGVGLFIFCPVALLAVWWIGGARRHLPDWVNLALIGGLLYQAVQLHLDVFHGGGQFYGNRLVTELVVLATPAAALGYVRWKRESRVRQTFAVALAGVGVATHAVGALLSPYLVGGSAGADWTRYYPLAVVQQAGVQGWVVGGTASAAVVLVTLLSWRGATPTMLDPRTRSTPRSDESTTYPLKAPA